MLKKVVYGIVAGSLVFAAQGALADDNQFWTGKDYQGVSALPFSAFSSAPTGADAVRGAMPSQAAPQEHPVRLVSASSTPTFPAPYDKDGGYIE